MATTENLKEAFAGESQANRKYLAFAKKAEADGLKQVARLFRATAEAETIHAHAHLRAMGGIKSTLENLREAAAGEAYEFQTMYPSFVTTAVQEGNKAASISFKNAMQAEEVHHRNYQEAVKVVEAGGDLPVQAVYICPVCGNIEYGQAPDRCKICGAGKDKFVEVK